MPAGLILIVDRASHPIHYTFRDHCHIVGRLGVLHSLRQHFFFRVAARLESTSGHQIIAAKDFSHGQSPCGIPAGYLAES